MSLTLHWLVKTMSAISNVYRISQSIKHNYVCSFALIGQNYICHFKSVIHLSVNNKKLKNKKYHTTRAFPKSNRKIIEPDAKFIYMTAHTHCDVHEFQLKVLAIPRGCNSFVCVSLYVYQSICVFLIANIMFLRMWLK